MAVLLEIAAKVGAETRNQWPAMCHSDEVSYEAIARCGSRESQTGGGL